MADAGQGASSAIDLAARVGEIGFAQFTSDLVTNIFGALVDANVRQTEQYIELVRALTASLADYINETHDEIGADQIDAFLQSLGVTLDGNLNAAERDALNDAVEMPPPAGVAGGDNRVAETSPNAALRTQIREAIARRIAANRYDFLQTMVQLGVLRVVVDHGVVETRLVVRTHGLTARGRREQSRERRSAHLGYAAAMAGFSTNVILGSSGGALGGYSVGGIYGASNHLAVSTATDYDRDVTGSNVQIFGKVELHFKTDYQPLNP